MEGFDPGLAYFYLTLPPGGDPAKVERRVLDELQRVGTEGVSDAELAKARNIMLADFWRGLATIDGKAAALGRYEVFHGDYEKLFDLPDDLDAVTAERLREVAKAVFRTNNMTVGVLQAPAAEVAE
jgi:zinc protease